MKKLLLLLTVLFVAIVAKADDMVLQVLLSDGQVVSINLNEEPRTTYQDGNLVITSTRNTVTYPLEKVRRFTYVSAKEENYKNHPLPIAYDFKSVDARERILYMNYNRVKVDVDQLIVEVQQEFL